MQRRRLLAFAVLALASCAHQPITDPQAPIVQATARVMIASLAEEQTPQRGYSWDALSIRISRYVHWHVAQPDPIDRPPDAITQRNGWLEGEGRQVAISARGLDDRVIELAFEHGEDFTWLSLLEALRQQGADVSFQADYETYSEYILAMPGHETAQLTMATSCSPFEARPARGCTHTLTLAFELP